MPITIIPSSHAPRVPPRRQPAKSIQHLLEASCPDVFIPQKSGVVAVASSLQVDGPAKGSVYPSSSSFVRSAIEAWAAHSHLVLRPDDVWFTILVQMNFYMQRNAEQVRDIFVAHAAGERELRVSAHDWAGVVEGFRDVVQAQLRAPWLAEWISPGFSTSSAADEQTATVLMMGLMKQYFRYGGDIICGMPSVTLLGARADWERLEAKLARLPSFGPQPAAYAARLRPILARITASFDQPNAPDTRAFWDQMVQARYMHRNLCGRPPTDYFVSGWLLGFFYWTATGDVDRQLSTGNNMLRSGTLEYDGVRYGAVYLEHLPIGYAKAQFTMLGEGREPGSKDYKGWILAGSIGQRIVNAAPEGYATALDALPGGEKGVETQAEASKENVEGEAAVHKSNERGCFSSIFGGLRWLFGRESTDARHTLTSNKDEIDEKQRSAHIHSTIQPLSGWLLFGPQTDPGPFYDDDQLQGPTVDAIKSCAANEITDDF